MSIIFYLFVIGLNLVFAFRKEHSKKVAILSLILILLLMGGAGPNYSGNPDYANYKRNYENVGSNNKTVFDDIFIGFNILMKIGNLFNISFVYFRFIIISLCLILIYHFIIKKYAYNYNYIILFYMLYPMIIDSEQLKNLIAFTFLFIGISFLIKNTFKNKIYFTIFLFLASSIHLAFILYLPLILINSSYKNKFIRFIFFLFIFITLLIIVNNNQIPFINYLLEYIDNNRLQVYLLSKTNYGFLIPFSLNIINIILVFLSRKIIVNNNKQIRKYSNNSNITYKKQYDIKRDYLFVDFVFWINIISIVFFPLYIKSITFYRLSRNLIILNINSFSIASIRLRKNSINKLIFNLFVFLNIFIWFYSDLIVTTSINSVLIPFFLRNILWF
jgi:hypothetical protein